MNDNYTISVDVDSESIQEYLADMEDSMQDVELFLNGSISENIQRIQTEYEKLSQASLKLNLVSLSECIDDVVKVCNVFNQFQIFSVKASELLLLVSDKIINITSAIADNMQINLMETQDITVSLQNIFLAQDEQQCEQGVDKALELLTAHINENSEPEILGDDINDLFLDFFDETSEKVDYFDEDNQQESEIDDKTETRREDFNAKHPDLSYDEMSNRTIEVIVNEGNPIKFALDIIEDLRNNELYSLIADIADKDTIYSKRHTYFVMEIVLAMNKLAGNPKEPVDLAKGIFLHDIGLVPYSDMLKQERRLTDDEFSLVKQHPLKSHLFASALGLNNTSLDAILHHHERIDGKGYPNGLKGDEISEPGKMVAIADSFQAMIHHRPHKKLTRSALRAINEINACVNTQFDQEWVKHFNHLMIKYWLPKNKDIFKTLNKFQEGTFY